MERVKPHKNGSSLEKYSASYSLCIMGNMGEMVPFVYIDSRELIKHVQRECSDYSFIIKWQYDNFNYKLQTYSLKTPNF